LVTSHIREMAHVRARKAIHMLRALCQMFATLVCCAVVSASLGQPRPRALVNAQKYRDALETGRIEFSLLDHGNTEPIFYTAQFAGSDKLVINHGDAQGVMGRSPTTGKGTAKGPHVMLVANGRTWDHESDTIFAVLFEQKNAPTTWHLRALGLGCSNSFDDVDGTLWRDAVAQPSARTYVERQEDGLEVVEATTDYGVITWWMDPQRGWSPVRVTFAKDGKVVFESRTTLQHVDGTWYPASVRFFMGGSDKPNAVVTVLSAAFNKPNQPRHLTPADMGMDRGCNIQAVRANGKTDFLMFDGENAVSQEEFARRMKAGQLDFGPRYMREIARSNPGAAVGERGISGKAKAVSASIWEQYTADFIKTYRLNDEQSEKAMAILHDCQDRARAYLDKHKVEFEEYEKRRENTLPKDKPADVDVAKELREQKTKLMQPIEDIFEDELKPRLDRLPTTAQRKIGDAEKAAEEARHQKAVASQPVRSEGKVP
jgi:hypothetical protein